MAQQRTMMLGSGRDAQVLSALDRLSFLRGNGDAALAIGMVLIVSLLIIPLPEFLLDLLLAVNITFSILILMVSLYIRSPLDISVFPTMLLVTTLFRLGLNISSTRLILAEGTAGDIIAAFGSFVIGGNYVVGIIIFLILVIINFIVIIKGSGRISEVTARFTLDALPGKQMSIDADLNAGFIDEQEARSRRSKLQRESEFYGAMDGASKFVKGDAIAGLIITAINIVGGFAIGSFQRGMPIVDSLATYTVLTIGDGLVSQIPSLLISVAAGLVVTRSASGETLEAEVGAQFTSNPRVLFVSGATLAIFSIIPGFPFVPFMMLSVITGAMGYVQQVRQRESAGKEMQEKLQAAEQPVTPPAEKPIEELLTVDPLELELGFGLIPLVDEGQGGDLFRRITNIRRQLAQELGIVLPPVRVHDNLQLEAEQYVIRIRGNEIARDRAYPGMYLAMDPGTAEGEVFGIRVTEPVFGLPATWVESGDRENAEILGYTVIEPEAVLSTHLTEVLRKNADRILDRQAVRNLLDGMKKEYPALGEEASPDMLPISILQKVLQGLLREGIPIRDLPMIVESLLDYVQVTKNIEVLVEYVRHSLSETIRQLYQDEKGVVHAIGLDYQIEDSITQALQKGSQAVSPTLGFSGDVLRRLHDAIAQSIDEMAIAGFQPIVITSATIRPYFYRLVHTSFPSISVVSFSELPSNTEVDMVSTIKI